ncbi:DUF3937 domain-containing protein [Bacillus pseudomycoides]
MLVILGAIALYDFIKEEPKKTASM